VVGSQGARRDPGQARLLPESLEGFADGPRWGLWALPPPSHPPAGALLAVQAVLDEQALSRRMLAHALHRLAGAGWTALAIDLWGTGDSAGWHDEASLERWRADLVAAAGMLRARAAGGPLALLGVRLGALLAVDLAARLPGAPAGLVLWNPPATGAALIDPLRRLERLALSGAAAAARGQGSAPSRLAGWPVQPALVEALRGLRLDASSPAASPGARLAIVHTQRVLAQVPAAPPAIAAALPAWQSAGWDTRVDLVAGEPWWSAMDACDPEALTERTLAALSGLQAGSAHEPEAHGGPPSEAAPRDRRPLPRFEPMVIAGSQAALVGALARTPGAPVAAVLVVPGQPQTRVGAHRMFVTLAAGLQARGIASLRIDIGGWGDSLGNALPFEAAGDDIVAAALALRARLPQAPLWLFGLCDGASALALALPALRRAGVPARGLCLLNPWVRSDATLAHAMLSGYYARRLADPAFWGRLLRGRVPWRHLIVDPLRYVGARLGLGGAPARSGKPQPAVPPKAGAGRHGAAPAGAAVTSAAITGPAAAGSAVAGVAAAGPSLPQVLLDRLEDFDGEVLTVLAGADLTAAETEALLAGEARWRERLARRERLLRLPGADHSLSDPAHEQAAIEWLAERIAELAAAR
jgi:exosortase A-associated hydrolase 2